jgi:hypothetical protein
MTLSPIVKHMARYSQHIGNICLEKGQIKNKWLRYLWHFANIKHNKPLEDVYIVGK